MRDYKLGLWGARQDKTGLGYQTREFYRAMKPDKTQVIDIDGLNQSMGKNTQSSNNWYKNEPIIHGFPNSRDCMDFVEGIDVAFLAESPYTFDFYNRARDAGVKTAVQYNYEFFDWFKFPELPKPDMLIAPSKWHYDQVDEWAKEHGIEHVYLHCPVNIEALKEATFPRFSAKRFIHIAGHTASYDRNGTESFLDATKIIEKAGLKFTVFTQDKELKEKIRHEYKHVDVVYNASKPSDMYKEGDVMVLPRRYGGNCLPMNEALACSLPVIMPKISPNTDFLPEQWLTNAEIIGQFEPRTVIDIYGVNPSELAVKMLWFSSLSSEDFIRESKKAYDLGQSISWEVLRPEYERVLGELCQTR